MQKLILENDGIIDREFITSFGVSVKDNESAIGFFGTGLKYAIAILLRNGCKVKIHSGGKVFRFGTKKTELKGKVFNFVTLNSRPLSFTTELGKRWQPWMAYRELYSNAKDEGGYAYIGDNVPNDTTGKTYVVVEGDLAIELHQQKDSIFVTPERNITNEIYETGGSFYSKGVCVWKYEDTPSLYSYNDARGYCDLTEDRQIKYTFQVMTIVTRHIAECKDKAILERIITADLKFFEAHADFDYCNATPTVEFMECALMHKEQCNNKSLIDYMIKHQPKQPLQEFDMNEYQRELMNEAIFSVRMAGFMVDEYPIKTVKKLDDDALGMASSGTIYISERCFIMGGLEMLKATLIEEWVHLKHGHKDCCRPMQNYLFEQLVRLIDQSNRIMKQKYAA